MATPPVRRIWFPRRGISLIETLIGISILLLAVVLMMSLLPSSWLAVHRGEQRLVAANLAQSLLEEQRSVPFEELDSGALPRVTTAHQVFEPLLEVEPVPGKPRLKLVRVRVRWEARGRPMEVVRQTTFCRVPL
ncbi:MAG: hypothetical protein HY319_23340 [Armatimonadetes bacterium]|nr:hypothetical protein [Armatimonadota bacterium]